MLIIYHADCFDGAAAAWALWDVYRDAKFCPATYGDAPPDVTGENVIIADFSYDPEVLVEMCKTAEKVTVIDHHETAIAKIDAYFNEHPFPVNLDLRLDIKRSGCGLAWDIAHHQNPTRPMIIDLIEDHDLWNFNLSMTRPFIAGLATMPISIETIDKVFTDLDAVIAIGEPLVEMENSQINRHLAESFPMFYCDPSVRHPSFTNEDLTGFCQEIRMTNCPRYHGSRVGEAMCKLFEVPFSITYYDDEKWRYFRLRSIKGVGPDVSVIASKFGGGGHTHAASFKRPRPDLFKEV